MKSCLFFQVSTRQMQPRGQRAGLGGTVVRRLGHLGFNSALGVFQDYLIHGFGG